MSQPTSISTLIKNHTKGKKYRALLQNRSNGVCDQYIMEIIYDFDFTPYRLTRLKDGHNFGKYGDRGFDHTFKILEITDYDETQ